MADLTDPARVPQSPVADEPPAPPAAVSDTFVVPPVPEQAPADVPPAAGQTVPEDPKAPDFTEKALPPVEESVLTSPDSPITPNEPIPDISADNAIAKPPPEASELKKSSADQIAAAPPEPPPLSGPDQAVKPKKKGLGTGLLITLLVLLVTLPVGVLVISQQQSLNDTRNRAANLYPNGSCFSNSDCMKGEVCTAVARSTSKICRAMTDPTGACTTAGTCANGYKCNTATNTCVDISQFTFCLGTTYTPTECAGRQGIYDSVTKCCNVAPSATPTLKPTGPWYYITSTGCATTTVKTGGATLYNSNAECLAAYWQPPTQCTPKCELGFACVLAPGTSTYGCRPVPASKCSPACKSTEICTQAGSELYLCKPSGASPCNKLTMTAGQYIACMEANGRPLGSGCATGADCTSGNCQLNSTTNTKQCAPAGSTISSPCLFCAGTNGRCTQNAYSGCNKGINECQTVGAMDQCANFVPKTCAEDGDIPTARNPCCSPLKIYNGRCKPIALIPTPSTIPADCATQVKCTSTSCTVGSYAAKGCFVSYYRCRAGSDLSVAGGSCDNRVPGTVTNEGLVSAEYQNCGIEQIDIYCPACGMTENHGRGVNFISQESGGSCGGKTPTQPPGATATPTPVPGQCTDIKAYKGNAELDAAGLAALKPGDIIVFAVKGSQNPTKARFSINGATPTETTQKNTAGEFVTAAYTVPEGVLNFAITSEVFVNGVWK